MPVANRRRIPTAMALGALALVAGLQAENLRCESVAGAGARCPAAAPNGVALARQLGGSACKLGVNWGWDGAGVWVKENCRGEFRLQHDPNVPESRLTCDSDHNRPQRCPVDNGAGFVIVPADSGSKCVAGQTWGYSVGSIWVNKGCRGSFSFAAVERGRGVRCRIPADAPQQRTLCPVDVAGGVTLEQDLLSSKCVYGQNWGLEAKGIWIEPSCAGIFRADGRIRGSESWSQPAELACESLDGTRALCLGDTADHVTLVTEASAKLCVQDRTWGFDAHGLWVDGGCRALFRLGK